MTFKSYYKIPAPQTTLENCVAHNGSLLPIPGRDVMVQAWYQGGISVFDWTDAAKPKEIAFFDRGPVDPTRMVMGGSWSIYWYNGLLVSSEIAARPRRLRAAAERVDYPERARCGQDRALRLPERAGAAQVRVAGELRQGARATSISSSATTGLDAATISATRADLASAEKLSGGPRQQALKNVATQMTTDAKSAADQPKVRMVSTAVTELAK